MPLDVAELLINGQFPRVRSYTLKYDLFAGAASFEADIDHDLWILPQWSPQQFEWRINGWPMMMGYIDKVERSYTKGEVTQKIYGRDMMQILLDSNVRNPKVYGSKTIKQIIDQIWTDNRSVTYAKILDKNNHRQDIKLNTPLNLEGLEFVWSSQATNIASEVPVIKQHRVEYNHSLFDAMSILLNANGIFLCNMPGTNKILIHSALVSDTEGKLHSYSKYGEVYDDPEYLIRNEAQTPPAKSQVTQDRWHAFTGTFNNVISGKFTIDTTEFGKFIRLVGQAGSEMELGGETTPFQNKRAYLIYDAIVGAYGLDPNRASDHYLGLNKFRCHEINVTDATAFYQSKDRLMDNLMLEQSRKLFNFEYKMAGHAPVTGGEPYYFKHLCSVIDSLALPSANSYLSDLMTYRVEFEGSKDGGTTTTLELCSPIPIVRSFGTAYYFVDRKKP